LETARERHYIRTNRFLSSSCSIRGDGILLFIVFVLGSEIMHLNKNSNNYFTVTLVSIAVITTAAVPFFFTPNIATPAAATTTARTTTTTPTSSPPSGVELSPQPIYQEQERLESQTPINQTHFQVVSSGDGTLTLPNGTETIRITSTKTGIVSAMEGAFSGKEIWITEDGSESATATVYEIARFNMQDGNGRGIVIVYIHTDSTGRLAPLNGTILTGIDEVYANQTGLLTLWEWQSRIPLQPSTTGGGGTTTTPGGGGTTTVGGDLNCEDITERNFAIDPNNDPHGFDGDNDGIGCETGGSNRIIEPEPGGGTTPPPGGGPNDPGPYGTVVR
jgi:hypothetical protein